MYDDVCTCHRIAVKNHLLNMPYSFNRIYFALRALQQPARAHGRRATCYVPIICHVARYATLKAHIRGGQIFDPRNAFQYNSIFSAAVLRRFIFLFKFEKAKVVQFGYFGVRMVAGGGGRR